MRYFRYLLLAILLLSAMCGCERKAEGPVVARINERTITLDEFRTELQKSIEIDPEFSDTPKGRDKLIDELVTKELLIQEAMNMGLEQEADFRWKIRKYYEQTLIENLMREKLDKLRVEVSEEEIEDRYRLMGKVYHLDIAEVKVPGSSGRCMRADEDLWQKVTAKECRNCHEVNVDADMEVMLDYLPKNFSGAIQELEKGDVSGPVLLGEKLCFVRLGDIEQVALPPLPEVREQIATTIERQKKSELMEKWIEDLRDNAAISVNREAIEGDK